MTVNVNLVRDAVKALDAMLTLADIAKMLDVSRMTVDTYKRKRKLPVIKIGFNARVDRDEFTAWAFKNQKLRPVHAWLVKTGLVRQKAVTLSARKRLKKAA